MHRLWVSAQKTETIGGWVAQNSDRYARTSKRRISNLQRAVKKIIAEASQDDVFGESESTEAYEEYYSSRDEGGGTSRVVEAAGEVESRAKETN